tara:strand:- start:14689 stop:16218 length:1530 start_codon:yes stop_codon:yes gene_type:complete
MKTIKTVLLYPPEQNWPDTMCKPNGSLAYPMLAGALREAGYEVEIFDACVGNEKDDLSTVFYNSSDLPSGMLKTGVSDERILEQVKDADLVGITSIFSHQETMVLESVRLIRKHFPDKLIVSGGVNARHRSKLFFDAGVDIICTSEAERTIIEIVKVLENNSNDFSHIGLIMEKSKGIINPVNSGIVWKLDELPLPAWDLLPNDRYWEIGRPHGGHFKKGTELKYASMMTSLGCPFSCAYCHIALEKEGSMSGDIGRFRTKSDERVLQELDILKNKIGVKQVFIEDDSIFGHKKRAIGMLKKISGFGLDILDVNGVNIIHLLKRGKPDYEVIELLAEVGFTDIVLPFESAHQRIIRKWCSNKWKVDNIDVEGLVRAIKDSGMRVAANYMIGFPDETREEVMSTIDFARENMKYGLDASNFFLVMPLPGTPMFDYAIRNNNLPRDFNPDKMHWQKANMKNTIIPPEELEEIRNEAWQSINRGNYVNYKKDMVVEDTNTGEIHTLGTDVDE